MLPIFMYYIKALEDSSSLFLIHTYCFESHLEQSFKNDSRFHCLGAPTRIWCISAIHGEIDQLADLHDKIFPHIQPSDRIIYTGNYIGYGKNSREVINELLAFRRATLAKQSMISTDIIYLRGAQEEIWQKVLQLQFSPNPIKTFTWMLGNGLSNTLYSYDLCPHDGIEACRQGIVGLSQWTAKLRAQIIQNPGHQLFTTHLVRAAFTSEDLEYPTLFVHAGLDKNHPLEQQGDNFWWGHNKFDLIQERYRPFEKVVRGYDPDHKGVQHDNVKITIDGGCGFGGKLVCNVFDQNGNTLDSLHC